MFACINMFWVQLRVTLARTVTRELNWVLRRAKHIHAQEFKLYYYYYHFEGMEKIRTEKKNDNQTVWKFLRTSERASPPKSLFQPYKVIKCFFFLFVYCKCHRRQWGWKVILNSIQWFNFVIIRIGVKILPTAAIFIVTISKKSFLFVYYINYFTTSKGTRKDPILGHPS